MSDKHQAWNRRAEPRMHPPEQVVRWAVRSGEEGFGILCNISGSGLAFVALTPTGPQLGRFIRIDFPGRRGEPLVAKVTRSEPDGEVTQVSCQFQTNKRAYCLLDRSVRTDYTPICSMRRGLGNN